jgi:choline dehydrogenase-like flavoprotein
VEFDYIVVGAGAAGCVLAGRLAAGRRLRVLLIEYGGRPVNPLLRVPKGFYYTLRGDRYLYRYLTSPVAPGGGPEVWLRGRVLGGSAAVNGMMWMRGAPADWDGLAARGNPGWSWADVLPAYRAMENHSLGASETRGGSGPLGISVTDTGDETARAILASAAAYGWAPVEDANASDTERIGFTPSTIRAGRRTTSYDAFVRPVLARQAASGRGPGRQNNGLTVATRTRAVSLTFDGRRVTGVQAVDGKGRVAVAVARREVILCAGSVETPLLLERSGIGRPEVLREHGIEPRIESPNVGMHLIEQRGVALQVTLKDAGGPPSRLSTRAGQATEALRWLATGQGSLATGGYDLVCQFKSRPREPRPDVQGLFVPMALDTSSKDLKLARHPGIFFMAYPMRPRTTSSVHVSGRAPGDPPVIDARFLETDSDRSAVAPVLGIARAVLATDPIASRIAAEEFPGPSVATGPDTVRYSHDTGTGLYHAVGSAAMGPGDDDVVDASLRVRGVAGLRIADASVLPVQVSGNTAAPAMLVGYRAADLILGELAPGERPLRRGRFLGPALLPPGDDAPDRLDERAHRERAAEGDHEAHHRLVLERLAADPPGEERVRGPDDGRDGGGGGEPPPRVPDEPAAQGHRGPPAGDEPADDDEAHPVPAQGALRPVSPGGPLLAGEEAPRRPRPEPPPDQVRQVVPGERADGRAQHDQVDPGVVRPGGRHAERDDHCLARQDGQDGVQAGQRERHQIGKQRADLQASDPAHRQPSPRRS